MASWKERALRSADALYLGDRAVLRNTTGYLGCFRRSLETKVIPEDFGKVSVRVRARWTWSFGHRNENELLKLRQFKARNFTFLFTCSMGSVLGCYNYLMHVCHYKINIIIICKPGHVGTCKC